MVIYKMTRPSAPQPAPPIPDNMVALMKQLAKRVIKERPDNIYEFSARFFEGLLIDRDGSLDKGYGKFRSYATYCEFMEKMDVREAAMQKRQVSAKTLKNLNSEADRDGRDSGIASGGSRPDMADKQMAETNGTGAMEGVRNEDDSSHMEVCGVAIAATPRPARVAKGNGKTSGSSNGNSGSDPSGQKESASPVKPVKMKIRKLSSKKPADDLIVITEETSSDVADTLAGTAGQILAARRIQRAFRRYLGSKRLLNERQGIIDASEMLAAFTIQRAFRGFVKKVRYEKTLQFSSNEINALDNTTIAGYVRGQMFDTTINISADETDGENVPDEFVVEESVTTGVAEYVKTNDASPAVEHIVDDFVGNEKSESLQISSDIEDKEKSESLHVSKDIKDAGNTANVSPDTAEKEDEKDHADISQVQNQEINDDTQFENTVEEENKRDLDVVVKDNDNVKDLDVVKDTDSNIPMNTNVDLPERTIQSENKYQALESEDGIQEQVENMSRTKRSIDEGNYLKSDQPEDNINDEETFNLTLNNNIEIIPDNKNANMENITVITSFKLSAENSATKNESDEIYKEDKKEQSNDILPTVSERNTTSQNENSNIEKKDEVPAVEHNHEFANVSESELLPEAPDNEDATSENMNIDNNQIAQVDTITNDIVLIDDTADADFKRSSEGEQTVIAKEAAIDENPVVGNIVLEGIDSSMSSNEDMVTYQVVSNDLKDDMQEEARTGNGLENADVVETISEIRETSEEKEKKDELEGDIKNDNILEKANPVEVFEEECVQKFVVKKEFEDDDHIIDNESAKIGNLSTDTHSSNVIPSDINTSKIGSKDEEINREENVNELISSALDIVANSDKIADDVLLNPDDMNDEIDRDTVGNITNPVLDVEEGNF